MAIIESTPLTSVYMATREKNIRRWHREVAPMLDKAKVSWTKTEDLVSLFNSFESPEWPFPVSLASAWGSKLFGYSKPHVTLDEYRKSMASFIKLGFIDDDGADIPVAAATALGMHHFNRTASPIRQSGQTTKQLREQIVDLVTAGTLAETKPGQRNKVPGYGPKHHRALLDWAGIIQQPKRRRPTVKDQMFTTMRLGAGKAEMRNVSFFGSMEEAEAEAVKLAAVTKQKTSSFGIYKMVKLVSTKTQVHVTPVVDP